MLLTVAASIYYESLLERVLASVSYHDKRWVCGQSPSVGVSTGEAGEPHSCDPLYPCPCRLSNHFPDIHFFLHLWACLALCLDPCLHPFLWH